MATNDDGEDGSGSQKNFVKSNFELNFNRLKESVLIKRPFFNKIFNKFGDKTLSAYAKEYLTINTPNVVLERQEEFLSVIKKMIIDLLGKEVADSAINQLRKYYFVSTSEHHGPPCSPFLLNSNLLLSLHCLDYVDPILKNIIVLSCSNISLNNFRPYTKQEIEKMKIALKDKVNSKEVGPVEADKISEILENIYNRPEIFDCESFSDQITKTNFNLWKKIFEKSHVEAPNLIYLEQETVVVNLLINYHLNQDTVINHILFDPLYDDVMLKYFEGIIGAFSIQHGWGTYLFWGVLKDKNYRVQLWKKGNKLVSNDGSISIELTPESLKKALEEKKIIPSLLMVFIVLNLYYGLKCLGAFNQVNYLTMMKHAYIRAMVDKENYRSIEVCARAQTKEIIGDLHLAFISDSFGELFQAMGLDLILYGDENTWQNICDCAEQITLKDALSITMPENYRVVYSDYDRDPVLAAISPEEVIKYLGLAEKIRPCGRIGRGGESRTRDLKTPSLAP